MSIQRKPSIVFVHGLWADGSCFSKLIPTLLAEGHEVIASQHGLDSHAEDVANVRRTLKRVSGPVVLVGHSYGGSVITAAGTDPRVAALVYIAAFAPGANETKKKPPGKVPTDRYLLPYRSRRWTGLAEAGRRSVFCGRSAERGAADRLGHACSAYGRPVQSEGRRDSLEIETELVHRCYQRPYHPARLGTFRRKAHGSEDI